MYEYGYVCVRKRAWVHWKRATRGCLLAGGGLAVGSVLICDDTWGGPGRGPWTGRRALNEDRRVLMIMDQLNGGKRLLS